MSGLITSLVLSAAFAAHPPLRGAALLLVAGVLAAWLGWIVLIRPATAPSPAPRVEPHDIFPSSVGHSVSAQPEGKNP